MSEQPHEDQSHSSFIKTPQQLIAVIVLSFVVPIALISIIASLVMSSHERPAGSDEAVTQRIKPVGEVVVAEGSDTPGQRSGKQVVDAVCSACHATGALNAPKIGDATAWAPHLKEGLDALTQVAIK